MLLRQCCHRYIAGRRALVPHRRPLPRRVPAPFLWITDETLHRAFHSFVRHFSHARPCCQNAGTPLIRKIYDPATDNRKVTFYEPPADNRKVYDSPRPKFGDERERRLQELSLRNAEEKEKRELGQARSPVISAIANAPANESILGDTLVSLFPTAPPESAEDLAAAQRRPKKSLMRQVRFQDLELKLKRGETSARAFLEEYRLLKPGLRYCQLSRECLVNLARELGELGMYRDLLDIWDQERTVAAETVSILHSAMRRLDPSRKWEILDGLLSACKAMGRHRFEALLKSEIRLITVDIAIKISDEAKARAKAREAEFKLKAKPELVHNLDDLKQMVSDVLAGNLALTPESSHALFRKLLDLDADYAIELALNPTVSPPGTANVRTTLFFLDERGEPQKAYTLFIRALGKGSHLLSDELDIKEGIKLARTPEQLVVLWNALVSHTAFSNMSLQVLAKFLWQCRNRVFNPDAKDKFTTSTWGNSLVRICQDVMIQICKTTDSVPKRLMAVIMAEWMWPWGPATKEFQAGPSSGVSTPSQLLEFIKKLPLDRADEVLSELMAVMMLDEKKNHRTWSDHTLWQLASAVSKTPLWRKEFGHFIPALEYFVLKKRLLPWYLRDRDDGFLARFAARNYLPTHAVETPLDNHTTVADMIQKSLESTVESSQIHSASRPLQGFIAAIQTVAETLPPAPLVSAITIILEIMKRQQEIVPLLIEIHKLDIPLLTRWPLFESMIDRLAGFDEEGALKVMQLYTRDVAYAQKSQLMLKVASRHPYVSYGVAKQLGDTLRPKLLMELERAWGNSDRVTRSQAQAWSRDLEMVWTRSDTMRPDQAEGRKLDKPPSDKLRESFEDRNPYGHRRPAWLQRPYGVDRDVDSSAAKVSTSRAERGDSGAAEYWYGEDYIPEEEPGTDYHGL